MVFKFTIDKLTDKHIPSNQVEKLPKSIGRFLGANDNQLKPRPDYLIWLEILLGTFCGVLLLEGVFRSPNIFSDDHDAPIIIASYGASAILCFNASQAPLAQPRNVIMGHFVAALIGTCIQKLFLLSQTGKDHYYLGGALSVAVASVLMLILNCVHPPAGASALLPLISAPTRRMGWWYLPTHLVSSVLMVSVAIITGNVIRKYPTYWWTPYQKPKPEPKSEPKPESQVQPTLNVQQTQPSIHHTDSSSTISKPLAIEITLDSLNIPSSLQFDENELNVLENFQMKLKSHARKSNVSSV